MVGLKRIIGVCTLFKFIYCYVGKEALADSPNVAFIRFDTSISNRYAHSPNRGVVARLFKVAVFVHI